MNKNILFFLFTFVFSYSFLFSQTNSKKNEFWINAGLTSEVLNVNATKVGSFKNRNRIGASLGIERRSYLKEYFSINYGLQVKSFRKSFIFNFSEVFIEDINFHIPILLNYNLKLADKHFANLLLGVNGVLQTPRHAEFSTLDYKTVVKRKVGIFPDLKFGFGYKFLNKRSFEINVLYNMGFFQRNVEIVKYVPSDSSVELWSNGSFVEVEFQFRLSK